MRLPFPPGAPATSLSGCIAFPPSFPPGDGKDGFDATARGEEKTDRTVQQVAELRPDVHDIYRCGRGRPFSRSLFVWRPWPNSLNSCHGRLKAPHSFPRSPCSQFSDYSRLCLCWSSYLRAHLQRLAES